MISSDPRLPDSPLGGGLPKKASGAPSGAAIPGWGATKLAAPGKGQAVRPVSQNNGAVRYATFGTFQQPKYITDDATQSVVNNQLAQGDAAGDARWLAKQFSQPGRSLGKGSDYMARVQGAATQAQARNNAATTQMNDAAQNSKMRTDFEYAREMEGQQLGSLQHALSQANWANRFNMQTNAARRLSAQQQAQLNVLGPLLDMFSSTWS